MKKKNLLTVLTISLIMLAFLGAIGINKVSATATPLISIYPVAGSKPGPFSVGATQIWQVRIDSRAGYGAPHETTEPNAVPTDKTWSWEVIISYDPSVLQVTTEPYRHATRDWFNLFHKWAWDPDFEEWTDMGPYGNFFTGTHDQAAGRVSAFCGLTEDPTKLLIPVGTSPFPNRGLHTGSYYDLPYTDGISTASLASPPGAWTGDYFILFIFGTTLLVDVPPGYSPIHIVEARLWEYDGKTLYPATTQDSDIGTPVAPEFPLGLAPIIMLAPAISIVYLWRIRKRKVR